MTARPEVLSPAGSWETLRAAVATGADAVYFGGHSFNARRNADNFSDGEIASAVAYCHARGVKAYLTLNTVLFEEELKSALDYVRIACEAGADALIVQDLGLVSLIRRAAPRLRLHASTQMSVHNIEGIRWLAGQGFSRVVLARELSRQELSAIAADSPVELEVFVHGALCMSVSGQCYLSAMLGGRSGNRGLCAQPCRLEFSCTGGTGRDLSLKDLSLIEKIGELARMGVASLKIEGRMKRPEYVAAATAACAKAARGEKVPDPELSRLRDVFSRGGFTDGYYQGHTGREMFGFRGRGDVEASQEVFSAYHSLYLRGETARVGVEFVFRAVSGKPLLLKVRDGDGNTAEISGAVPQPALNHPLDEAFIRDKLSKTGGTPFFAESVKIQLGGELSVPVSELNRLRRGALDALLEKRARPKAVSYARPEFSTVSTPIVENFGAFRVRLQRAGQLTPAVLASGAQIVFLPIAELRSCEKAIASAVQNGARVGAELPRAAFGSAGRRLSKDIDFARELGIQDLLCGNLGVFSLALKSGMHVHGDFGLNVTNSEALELLCKSGADSCILSFEARIAQMKDAVRGNCGAIVYGRLPLMLVRNCPLKNGAGCANCPGRLTDRRGISFPVVCAGPCSELLNSRPLWMLDRLDELYRAGISFVQLYFTTETPGEVDGVLSALKNRWAPHGEFTRGLYYRGVE